MDQRYSTIIFVPHARAKFRKLKVSHRLLISLVSFVTSSLCLSTFFSVQYFTSLSQTHELTKLRRENKDLQSANEQFSKSVESLRTQLRTVEDRTRKLAIIAGINTLDESSQGGVGGLRPADLGDNPYRTISTRCRSAPNASTATSPCSNRSSPRRPIFSRPHHRSRP